MNSKHLRAVASDIAVLYAEDDPIISESFERYLSRFFKKVVKAKNGAEALEAYKQERFELVLTDIDMPVMDGLKLIEEVRRIDEFQVVMVSSAKSDAKLLIDLLNKGVFGFIPKPVNLDEATAHLHHVCDRIQDKKMLMHYVAELEAIGSATSEKRCSGSCVAQSIIQEYKKAEEPSIAAAAEEDEFEFFPSPTPVKQENKENDLIYHDYFRQLLDEDREELSDQLGDIDSSLMAAFSDRGGNALYVSKLGASMMRYGNVLMHYQFFSDMGVVILQLGQKILEHADHVAENAKDMQMYIGGFCSVIQNFLHEVWETEADNPKFFNDSIINDATTIISLITPAKVEEDNDDLVFF